MLKDNIKKIRENNHISQRELARKIGMSSQMISKIERGESSPSLETLTKIAAAFNMPLNKLIEDKIVSADDLFEKFNIDKSILEMSQSSGLSFNTVDRIFSPYRKGYTDEDLKILCKSLNLTDKQIQDWLLFDNRKPYENRMETELSYWYHCIANYPYETIDEIDITEFKMKYVKEIVKELDSTFKNKVREISKRESSDN